MQTEEDARRLLERPLDYPGLVQRRRASQEVRIWRAPSFDPESSWTIIVDKSEWFVRRVVYIRRSAAGEIWHDTFASEARLAEPVALSLVRDLRAICIAPFVKVSGLGLDGARSACAVHVTHTVPVCMGYATGWPSIRFSSGIAAGSMSSVICQRSARI